MTKFYTDKQKIINWLDKYEVKNYTLIRDEKYGFIVDINGDVNLSYRYLITIPVKFNEVIGSFDCSQNKLSSLKFSPQEVGGGFYCHSNKLTSLKFCPKKVGVRFWCYSNKLTSLEFCPHTVAGSFYCGKNPELKEIQEINDFKLLYLEHIKILATNLSDKLSNDLVNDNSKKTAKIKI